VHHGGTHLPQDARFDSGVARELHDSGDAAHRFAGPRSYIFRCALRSQET
jgi:hypothetical protein